MAPDSCTWQLDQAEVNTATGICRQAYSTQTTFWVAVWLSRITLHQVFFGMSCGNQDIHVGMDERPKDFLEWGWCRDVR